MVNGSPLGKKKRLGNFGWHPVCANAGAIHLTFGFQGFSDLLQVDG